MAENTNAYRILMKKPEGSSSNMEIDLKKAGREGVGCN
jgi:hypothetical protein